MQHKNRKDSHQEKITELKKLREQYGMNYFHIQETSARSMIRNILYYNRKARLHLDVDSEGRVRFPYTPNYEQICEVYYAANKNYNRKKSNNDNQLPITIQVNQSINHTLQSRLMNLSKEYGQDELFKVVCDMMNQAGYTGQLVKKNTLIIG
jgi:hypothetical protein